MMSKNGNGKEKTNPLACPHCGAGEDENTVGLFWDFNEHCWHCVICGHRVYEQTLQPKSQIGVVAETIWDDWDEVLDAIDESTEQGNPCRISSI